MPSQRMPIRPAIEAVLTMWPPCPCSTSSGTKVSTPCTTPQKFTFIVNAQSRWVDCRISPKVATPALLQMMWAPPKCRRDAAASACTLSSRVTSVGTPTTVAPAPCSSMIDLRSAASSRSARTTLAPRAAKARAIAMPIPPAPPVMTATRSRNGSIAAPTCSSNYEAKKNSPQRHQDTKRRLVVLVILVVEGLEFSSRSARGLLCRLQCRGLLLHQVDHVADAEVVVDDVRPEQGRSEQRMVERNRILAHVTGARLDGELEIALAAIVLHAFARIEVAEDGERRLDRQPDIRADLERRLVDVQRQVDAG